LYNWNDSGIDEIALKKGQGQYDCRLGQPDTTNQQDLCDPETVRYTRNASSMGNMQCSDKLSVSMDMSVTTNEYRLATQNADITVSCDAVVNEELDAARRDVKNRHRIIAGMLQQKSNLKTAYTKVV